jgi:hypothetical protein
MFWHRSDVITNDRSVSMTPPPVGPTEPFPLTTQPSAAILQSVGPSRLKTDTSITDVASHEWPAWLRSTVEELRHISDMPEWRALINEMVMFERVLGYKVDSNVRYSR